MPARSSRPKPTAAELIAIIRSAIGRPYEWGATGPNAFDCSGLIKWGCDRAGVKGCPRTSQEQFGWCEHTDTARAGDLVFFVGAEGEVPPGHVGLVVAPGVMIQAPFTGQNVQQSNFGTNGTGAALFMGYGRIPGLAGSTANQSLITARNRSGPGSKDSTTAIASSVIGSVMIVIIALAAAALIVAMLFIGSRYAT